MKERLYGLDLFRILAMFMITALHINYQHCNLFSNGSLPAGLYYAGLLIEYICFAGVNCFAMLSGYFMSGGNDSYDRKWGYRCVSFWGKMSLWGALLYLAVYLCFPGGSDYPLNIEAVLFPFDGFWWYINAYCGLLIFMPLLNAGLNKCSLREMWILAAVLFVVTSVIPTCFLNGAPFILHAGYSTLWLMICFIYGAVIKKLSPQILQIKRINLILSALLIACIAIPVFFEFAGFGRILCYTSPFCVLEAACLLMLFQQIKIRNIYMIKLISFVSINSLGIYLVQNYPYVWNTFIGRNDPPIYEPVKYLWYLPGMILLLMVIGVAVNFIVDKIFKHAGCDSLCRKLFSLKG